MYIYNHTNLTHNHTCCQPFTDTNNDQVNVRSELDTYDHSSKPYSIVCKYQSEETIPFPLIHINISPFCIL